MKKNHTTNRIIQAIPTAIMFGIVFMIAGYVIPNVYYRFFDGTTYYQIQNPLTIEARDYKPCDMVNVYVRRSSLIDSQGDSIINLSLVRDGSGTRERVSTEVRRISISRGDGTIITQWGLPCSISPGEYFFEGTVKYQVRGFDKYTSFQTETFLVGEVEKDAN